MAEDSVVAEITLRDGRICYQSVMFPNDRYWAAQIKRDPNVVYVQQVPADGPRYSSEQERLAALRQRQQ